MRSPRLPASFRLRRALPFAVACALASAGFEGRAQDAAAASAASSPVAAADDAARSVAFVEEFAALCVSRNGVQILVRNTHPTRTVRVWLERYVAGIGTGDRSRSDLRPGAEPDPLGCSVVGQAKQEWRFVKAAFVD